MTKREGPSSGKQDDRLTFKRRKIEAITPAPPTKEIGHLERSDITVELSSFQLEYQKTQIGRLEKAETLYQAIPENGKNTYNQIRRSGQTSLRAKESASDLPMETQIAIAKTLSAENVIEGGIERYALEIDGLTGLNKEHALKNFLEAKKAAGAAVSAIHFDIDKFKDFNDNYGHAAGDEVLQVGARVLMQLRGDSGFAARNHDRGEEFTLIFSEDEMTQAEIDQYGDVQSLTRAKAEQLREAISQIAFRFKNIKSEKETIDDKNVTASIGIAHLKENESIQDFRSRAEHASSHAKNIGGRNKVQEFNEDVENWYLAEIAQSSSDSKDQLDAVRDEPGFKSKEVDPNAERKDEAFTEASGTFEGEIDNETVEVLLVLRDQIESGSFIEVEDFEKLLAQKNITNQESIRDLWFMHAALAETNAEIFGDQARRDSLTKLYNRQEIGRMLSETLYDAESSGETVSIALLDMDFFKKINDTYGHDIGDEMLKQIAQFLEEAVSDFKTVPYIGKGRSEDSGRITRLNGVTGRWGGEEFFIFVPGMDAKTLQQEINEKIIARLNKTEFIVTINGEPRTIKQSLTFGIVQNRDGNSFKPQSEMLEEADKALYAGKLLGRNQANIYTEELNQEAIRLEKIRQQTEGTDELIR